MPRSFVRFAILPLRLPLGLELIASLRCFERVMVPDRTIYIISLSVEI